MRNLDQLLNLKIDRKNNSENKPLWLVEKAYTHGHQKLGKENKNIVLLVPNIT